MKHNNVQSRVLEIPFNKHNGSLIFDVSKVDKGDIVWNPNILYFEKYKFIKRFTPSQYGKKSQGFLLESTSMPGAFTRLMGSSVMDVLLEGHIQNGCVEGYWIYTRYAGGFYGIRWVKKSKVPKKFRERVEQIRSTSDGELRESSRKSALRVPAKGTSTWENI